MSGLTNPSPATNLKFDANNNVLANVNAQNINPTTEALNAYSPTLLSHQTGLSVTATAANTYYNIGTSITAPRTGILKISIIGHVNTASGFIAFNITKGTATYQSNDYSTSTSDFFTSIANGNFNNTVAEYLLHMGVGGTSSSGGDYTMELPIDNGDVIQPIAANTGAADITYIDDLLVILQ